MRYLFSYCSNTSLGHTLLDPKMIIHRLKNYKNQGSQEPFYLKKMGLLEPIFIKLVWDSESIYFIKIIRSENDKKIFE